MREKLFGKASQGQTKLWWCAFCGEETAWCRKEASKVVQVIAAQGRKNGSGVGGEKTALGEANCKGVFGGETARGGKM
ncbi:hypothetical protein T11_17726, partial [Trichinella zimbabwensis]